MHLSPTVWGVLLAAGAGRRFAEQQPGQDKLLCPLPNGSTLLSQSAAALQAHCEQMVVVLPTNQPLRDEIVMALGVPYTYNPDANQGMGSSLAVGAHYLQQLGQRNQPPALVLVALADMPWIKPCSYQAIIKGLSHEHAATTQRSQHDSINQPSTVKQQGNANQPDEPKPHHNAKQPPPKRIAAPVYGQQRGHPVAFCWSLIDALAEQQGDQGARNLLKQYGCLEVAVNDPGIVHDIDN